MLVTNVDLVNGSQILLLEDFFPVDILRGLMAVCRTYPEPDSWTVPFGSDDTTLRRSYTGTAESITAAQKWLASDECVGTIAQYIQAPIQYSDMHLWCDVYGVTGIKPHKEQGGEYLAQFFITDKEHSYTGTTIYNDDRRILFQMPYRNNYGWFFRHGTTVMHGRAHPVPKDLLRFSLLVWYQTPV
jgi:hypothetical protein